MEAEAGGILLNSEGPDEDAADEGCTFVDAVCDVGTADDERGVLDEFEERLLDSDVDEEPFDVPDDT